MAELRTKEEIMAEIARRKAEGRWGQGEWSGALRV
jgi:hypothetical protein